MLNSTAKNFLFMVCFSFYLFGCYYDVEQELYPANDCDITNVTYTSQISTIIKNNCISCHGVAVAGSSGGGVNLEGYAALKTQVDNGKFSASINHTGTASPMPKGGNKLPACELSYVQTWISNGALNN